MKADQVDQALRQKFLVENERLVFWNDPNAEFESYVGEGFSGDLARVQILDVAKLGALSTKIQLERKDPAGQYLVYSRGDRPPGEEDWLLDIRLYSAEFHADVASLWLQELELSTLSIRDHLKTREAFLASQDRRKKLRRLLNPEDDPSALDLKMLAVLAGSTVARPSDILQSLCDGHAENGEFSLLDEPKALEAIAKMGLADEFWRLMRAEFAYEADEPSLAGLLRRLFISELFHEADGARMDSLAHHQLSPAGSRNAVVFLTHWRDSSGHADSYDAAARAVAQEQGVGGALSNLEVESARNVFTFWEADRRVVSSLKDRILEAPRSVDVEFIREVATERKSGHWLSGARTEMPEHRAIARAYDALVAASELFALSAEHENGLSFAAPQDLLEAYQSELYRFDQLYRRFCADARFAERQGWDLLKTLTGEIERVYHQSFLKPLGVEWSRLLDAGFLDDWKLDALPAQQAFYADEIAPHLAESSRKRAFVIVSDAFRYEAAAQLTEELKGRYRMDATLSSMLGVLPSYTALGMASLLPHETLAYTDKGEVLVDGKAVAGTDARHKQLAKFDGMACQAQELRTKTADDAREFTRGKRVVYIYHNVVDARGDSASTESETFEAVADCISELFELVQFCVSKLNAAKVWVTADHGFLYQQDAPSETDKSKLSHKPANAVKEKKRYVIGRGLGESDEAHHGSIAKTAGAEGDMEFWIPRAANRFHFTGGARFVHGGAMPQEIVVPLVTITQLRGDRAAQSKTEKVSVQVLGGNHKITTPSYRFEFIQTDAVSERRKPITLRAAVYDGAAPVTAIETLTFDSASKNIDERKKAILLKLRSGTYDKTKPYRLVLRDAENDAEVQSVPVVIDRSFDDDF